MKKYTLEDIKKLPAMQMEEVCPPDKHLGLSAGCAFCHDNQVRNLHRHKLLEEMKE